MYDKGSVQGIEILLVEDNPINQLVTRDLLQEMKVTVLVANNGQEALDILATDKDFDVILMDLQMPVLDGFETIKEIRGRNGEQISHIPILALSANVIETEIEKSYACGANHYLSKPFKPETLYQRINNLITNSNNNYHETNKYYQ
jgi:CheY-like chemotaxis protein